MSRAAWWATTPKTPFPKPVDAAPNCVNVWTCQQCGKRLITIDRHIGVTPFMMRCDPERTPGGCGSQMYSAFYRVEHPELWATLATHEWYAPDESERKGMSRGMIDHVIQGGLDIRPITKAAEGTTDG